MTALTLTLSARFLVARDKVASGWCQHNRHFGRRVCLLGALDWATDTVALEDHGGAWAHMTSLVIEIIGEAHLTGVAAWNDAPTRRARTIAPPTGAGAASTEARVGVDQAHRRRPLSAAPAVPPRRLAAGGVPMSRPLDRK